MRTSQFTTNYNWHLSQPGLLPLLTIIPTTFSELCQGFLLLNSSNISSDSDCLPYITITQLRICCFPSQLFTYCLRLNSEDSWIVSSLQQNLSLPHLSHCSLVLLDSSQQCTNYDETAPANCNLFFYFVLSCSRSPRRPPLPSGFHLCTAVLWVSQKGWESRLFPNYFLSFTSQLLQNSHTKAVAAPTLLH